MRPKVYQFFLALFAAFGSFLYGYDLGVIASVVASDSFADKFLTIDATTRSGTVVALFTAGGFFGAFAAGFCDPLARRGTLAFGSCLFIVGGILQTSAQEIGMLYAGRLIAGFGIGILVEVVPIFQAEFAHASIRGILVSLQQAMLGIGSLAASWIGYGCFKHWAHTGNTAQWRIPLGLQMVPAVGLAACIYLFPESPRWLIDHGRSEEGLETLARLHANGNKDDPYVQAEYEIIRAQISEEHEHAAKSYAELFRTRANTRRIILACACQASAQMTGVSAIQYFSPAIFAQIEVAQFIFFFLIDRVGRRPLQIGGNLACAVAFVIGAALLAEFPPTSSNSAAHWSFIVASTWVFNFCFCASGTMSWIIPAEIFNTATRAKGVSLATMVSFAFNTMIGQVTPVALAKVGWRYYLLFIICDIGNALFFYLFCPETKGLSLEAMDDLFTNSSWLVPGSKWAPSLAVNPDAVVEMNEEEKFADSKHAAGNELGRFSSSGNSRFDPQRERKRESNEETTVDERLRSVI
ncbi:general substrate transporter [Gymnopus androsaceus JB14]|uniref:General substrate transporter n=1 Tax=Gymnopus androsaceus JB14 TaxID=1447944 RepID=A0A6A4IB38_9AGAR|nr:general substrate transporter [Gymnopus androsaceus JB14]